MATKGVIAPRLPTAPVEYDRDFMDSLFSILRQYFNGLDNPGPIVASTQKQPATSTTPALIVSALSCSQPNSSGVTVISLPTQADLALLRSGDVYYDTTAGNVLKIKA